MGEAVVGELLAAHTVAAGQASGTRPADETQAAARRDLRGQIARLEATLADETVAAFAARGQAVQTRPSAAAPRSGAPRLLTLGELECVRDELALRLGRAHAENAALAAAQAAKRELLAEMLLEPGRHRFTRISNRELGEPGCGVWQVRPRLGLIGMLAGWWQVKLSSGCPLAGARGGRPRD